MSISSLFTVHPASNRLEPKARISCAIDCLSLFGKDYLLPNDASEEMKKTIESVRRCFSELIEKFGEEYTSEEFLDTQFVIDKGGFSAPIEKILAALKEKALLSSSFPIKVCFSGGEFAIPDIVKKVFSYQESGWDKLKSICKGLSRDTGSYQTFEIGKEEQELVTHAIYRKVCIFKEKKYRFKHLLSHSKEGGDVQTISEINRRLVGVDFNWINRIKTQKSSIDTNSTKNSEEKKTERRERRRLLASLVIKWSMKAIAKELFYKDSDRASPKFAIKDLSLSLERDFADETLRSSACFAAINPDLLLKTDFSKSLSEIAKFLQKMKDYLYLQRLYRVPEENREMLFKMVYLQKTPCMEKPFLGNFKEEKDWAFPIAWGLIFLGDEEKIGESSREELCHLIDLLKQFEMFGIVDNQKAIDGALLGKVFQKIKKLLPESKARFEAYREVIASKNFYERDAEKNPVFLAFQDYLHIKGYEVKAEQQLPLILMLLSAKEYENFPKSKAWDAKIEEPKAFPEVFLALETFFAKRAGKKSRFYEDPYAGVLLSLLLGNEHRSLCLEALKMFSEDARFSLKTEESAFLLLYRFIKENNGSITEDCWKELLAVYPKVLKEIESFGKKVENAEQIFLFPPTKLEDRVLALWQAPENTKKFFQATQRYKLKYNQDFWLALRSFILDTKPAALSILEYIEEVRGGKNVTENFLRTFFSSPHPVLQRDNVREEDMGEAYKCLQNLEGRYQVSLLEEERLTLFFEFLDLLSMQEKDAFEKAISLGIKLLDGLKEIFPKIPGLLVYCFMRQARSYEKKRLVPMWERFHKLRRELLKDPEARNFVFPKKRYSQIQDLIEEVTKSLAEGVEEEKEDPLKTTLRDLFSQYFFSSPQIFTDYCKIKAIDPKGITWKERHVETHYGMWKSLKGGNAEIYLDWYLERDLCPVLQVVYFHPVKRWGRSALIKLNVPYISIKEPLHSSDGEIFQQGNTDDLNEKDFAHLYEMAMKILPEESGKEVKDMAALELWRESYPKVFNGKNSEYMLQFLYRLKTLLRELHFRHPDKPGLRDENESITSFWAQENSLSLTLWPSSQLMPKGKYCSMITKERAEVWKKTLRDRRRGILGEIITSQGEYELQFSSKTREGEQIEEKVEKEEAQNLLITLYIETDSSQKASVAFLYQKNDWSEQNFCDKLNRQIILLKIAAMQRIKKGPIESLRIAVS